MGTRGTILIKFNGKWFKVYNHLDSYFEGLGMNLMNELVELLKLNSVDNLILKLERIKIVDDNVLPTQEDINNLKEYTSLGVSNQSTDDWYCLTRECQGSLKALIESGYALSLDEKDLEEYNYCIDFDKKEFFCNDKLVCNFNGLEKLCNKDEPKIDPNACKKHKICDKCKRIIVHYIEDGKFVCLCNMEGKECCDGDNVSHCICKFYDPFIIDDHNFLFDPLCTDYIVYYNLIDRDYKNTTIQKGNIYNVISKEEFNQLLIKRNDTRDDNEKIIVASSEIKTQIEDKLIKLCYLKNTYRPNKKSPAQNEMREVDNNLKDWEKQIEDQLIKSCYIDDVGCQNIILPYAYCGLYEFDDKGNKEFRVEPVYGYCFLIVRK
ncbi:MAG: hypothetical protein Edafosvirus33_3 [Edafosvirus sp.]|uniref:Uncharacterized protein n=1 Tax=Edafosvirus sp. TaxID=2487765 RepID=A0A3G4ZYX5_9VIRU|nr:MAG: hypothetical protein Edafosvirus33_3 [Edafosvirus sp.]